jgi:hypothetical protein
MRAPGAGFSCYLKAEQRSIHVPASSRQSGGCLLDSAYIRLLLFYRYERSSETIGFSGVQALLHVSDFPDQAAEAGR